MVKLLSQRIRLEQVAIRRLLRQEQGILDALYEASASTMPLLAWQSSLVPVCTVIEVFAIWESARLIVIGTRVFI